MSEAVLTRPANALHHNHSKRRQRRHTSYGSLMRYARLLGFGDVHTNIDEKTGLFAIVAIHNLTRGPAIGGCRMINYSTTEKAMEDALRLGYMMSYKAAINNLPHGGAKAVLIKPKVIVDREAYFEKFGEFVAELGGRYITAVDSGTSPLEMDIIARKTRFVTCTSDSESAGDPSPLTALGVRRGIEAAVKFQLNRDNLEGVRVAVQGTGHVGYSLIKSLHQRGAIITATDVNTQALERVVKEFNVQTCAPDAIYDVEADVFAPNALGAVLNLNTVYRLRVKVVAGAANNQLAHRKYGDILKERGILYAPDFLINAGGLIHVAVIYDHGTLEKSIAQIENIYHTAYDIFERAQRENCATNTIAEKLARERL